MINLCEKLDNERHEPEDTWSYYGYFKKNYLKKFQLQQQQKMSFL